MGRGRRGKLRQEHDRKGGQRRLRGTLDKDPLEGPWPGETRQPFTNLAPRAGEAMAWSLPVLLPGDRSRGHLGTAPTPRLSTASPARTLAPTGHRAFAGALLLRDCLGPLTLSQDLGLPVPPGARCHPVLPAHVYLWVCLTQSPALGSLLLAQRATDPTVCLTPAMPLCWRLPQRTPPRRALVVGVSVQGCFLYPRQRNSQKQTAGG